LTTLIHSLLWNCIHHWWSCFSTLFT